MELGEHDISGPTEYMSTKEKAVRKIVDFSCFSKKKSLVFWQSTIT